MTVLPPGLIAPPDRPVAIVRHERATAAPARRVVRWNSWSIAFAVLVALTVLAVALAVADLLNG